MENKPGETKMNIVMDNLGKKILQTLKKELSDFRSSFQYLAQAPEGLYC